MFSFGKEFSAYWRSLTRILYPAACVLCRVPLFLREEHLCSACFQKIEFLKTPPCIRCARTLPAYGDRRASCPSCRSHRPYYDRGFALVPYSDAIKELFHQIKFQNKPWLLSIFSNLMRIYLSQTNFSNCDFVVPIPLDSERERERGFNQALMIAHMIKRIATRQSFMIKTVLKKKTNTPRQSQLARSERLTNLSGAFRLNSFQEVRGKHVLLVDDIFTTGSTVNECAKLLKEKGAERVDFFAIARAQTG